MPSIVEHQPNSPSSEDIKEIMTNILFELDQAVKNRVASKRIMLQKELEQHKNYGINVQ